MFEEEVQARKKPESIDLITTKEAARKLHITESAIKSFIREGRLQIAVVSGM